MHPYQLAMQIIYQIWLLNITNLKISLQQMIILLNPKYMT